MVDNVVIVGAGQAGGWVARTVRDCGYDGRLTLIGAERHPPYERPPLSKQVLVGEAPALTTHLFSAETWDGFDLDLRTGTTVASIDPGALRLELDDGSVLDYGALVLATGGRARALPDLPHLPDHIFMLRTIEDSLALGAALRRAARVVVVGGGWIGLEVASSAHKLGCAVTVIEAADHLCARAAPRHLSDALLALHRQAGIDVRLCASLAGVDGGAGGVLATLADGSEIEADTLVVGIGLVPSVELAMAAGLACDNGILVDQDGRSSDPKVFAVGDVANRLTTGGRRRRLESWQCAQNEGIAVGHTLLALPRPKEEPPWFWSDQHGTTVQLMGDFAEHLEQVERRVPTGVLRFMMSDGRVVGATAVGAPAEAAVARRLVAQARRVDPARLADATVRAKALLRD